ncbi:MAG TPA: ATP-binding domain-containing protein [Burkholderiaceae bacterium]
MPKIVPSDWATLKVTGAAEREIETLAMLARCLPPELTVFHGVHWTRIRQGFAVIGEIDFVVLGPAGRLLLIEQKSGFLDETADGLVKQYAPGTRKHVGQQLARTLDAVSRRLREFLPDPPGAIDYLLYCPDYTVKEKGAAGIPDERIVDAARRGELCRRIVEAFPAEPPRPDIERRLSEFFSNELRLVPDTNALVGRAEQIVTRLSGGLATWARRLEFEPFRLRVAGTAGSGKTQLAVALLAEAAKAGRRVRYVCFNRPLADHLSRIAAAGAEVSTFHQLCDRRLRAAGATPDFTRPDAFDELARRFAELDPGDDAVDELIVDEGQDFDQSWVEPLLKRLAPRGRAWWLEDPAQQLYERPPPELPGWVVMRDDTNYRTPRDIVDQINRLKLVDRPIEPAGPIEASEPEFLDYRDTAELIERTKRAVTLALMARFRKEDIAIVTFAGRERSKLLPFDALGPHRLKSFSGSYDLFGAPRYSEGEVLIETVYRFKGQAAPCIVLTEVDFEALDDRARRRLFVGMTRASMKLFVVRSARAAEMLMGRLSG